MGEHRMLSKAIIEGDTFCSMPADAQMLYIHLNMEADDYGFIDSPRKVMRAYGASDDSMKLLITKKFVLTFQRDDNFIVLIKHWRIHNMIRADRVKETRYKEILHDLYYDENKAYSATPGEGHIPCLPNGNQVTTNCQPTVNQLPAQAKISKDKLSEDKLSEAKQTEEPAEEEGFFGPPLIVLESFAKKNGIEPEEAQAFKTYWDSRKWMTAAGEQVADWKAMFVYQHEHGIPKGKKYQTAREYNEAMKAAPVPTLEQLEFLRDSI